MKSKIRPQVVEGAEAKRARLAREKGEVEVNVNRHDLPADLKMITIIYDPNQNQMQVQGHLGELEICYRMLDMAKQKINELHASNKKV